VRRCLGGEVNAFSDLIERYQRPMFNVALRVVNDPDDAADVVQTAFLKAYQRLETYNPQYRFFSWIYRITFNESLNQRRKARPSTSLTVDLVDTGATPEELTQESEIGRQIGDAMMDISLDYRCVLVLRHFLGFSHKDIATTLDIPEKTVKSRLFSARKQMHRALRKRGVQRP